MQVHTHKGTVKSTGEGTRKGTRDGGFAHVELGCDDGASMCWLCAFATGSGLSRLLQPDAQWAILFDCERLSDPPMAPDTAVVDDSIIVSDV